MQTRSGTGGTGVNDGSPLRTFFTGRLQHLVEQRGRWANMVGPDDWRRRLVSRALYSAYRDLADLGFEDDAQEILGQGQTANRN